MKVLTTENIIKIVDLMTEIILKNEVLFCEFDSHAGDGDLGMSLASGFRKLKEGRDGLEKDNIGAFLRSSGGIIAEYCGGASGPIWGGAFKAAGRFADGKTEINLGELAAMLNASVEAIQKRGGAKLGDKTLLDALIPTAESLKDSDKKGVDLKTAMKTAAKAAVDVAEKTKNMVASRGRASYLGDRSIGYEDAGAKALGIIFTFISENL